jgi:hypothetical protein
MAGMTARSGHGGRDEFAQRPVGFLEVILGNALHVGDVECSDAIAVDER